MNSNFKDRYLSEVIPFLWKAWREHNGNGPIPSEEKSKDITTFGFIPIFDEASGVRVNVVLHLEFKVLKVQRIS